MESVRSMIEQLRQTSSPGGSESLDVVWTDQVPRREVEWLWPGRIPLGKVTLLAGDPNAGKSYLTMWISAVVTSGLSWEAGGEGTPPGKVLLLSGEDDIEDTIRPRIEAMGGDVSRVNVVRGVVRRGMFGERLGAGVVRLSQHLDGMMSLVRQDGGYRLVIIDPISAYVDGIEANLNSEVRALFARIQSFAEQSGIACLLVTHLRKGGQGGSAIHRMMGSLAFVAAARAVWLVTRDPNERERRLLVPLKMNLIAEPTGLSYRIVGGRIEWEPEPVLMDAESALSVRVASMEASEKVERCTRWLGSLLSEGPQLQRMVEELAREEGFGHRALVKAKRALQVTSRKVLKREGEPSRWEWVLRDEVAMKYLAAELD